MPDLTKPALEGCVKLGEGSRGLRGTIVAVGNRETGAISSFDEELERRLLEIGLVEGARVEILHEGFIGRDPIAVRVDDMRVALRRREANTILVQLDAATEAPGGAKDPDIAGSPAAGPGAVS